MDLLSLRCLRTPKVAFSYMNQLLQFFFKLVVCFCFSNVSIHRSTFIQVSRNLILRV